MLTRCNTVLPGWGSQVFQALRTCATALAGCVILTAGVAHAQDGPVTIEVVSEVPPRCGFAGGELAGQMPLRDLERSARFDIRIGLDCNTPYAFGVVATHGLLTNLTARSGGSGGYAYTKRYSVSVALHTDQGTVRSDACISSDLVLGGTCMFAAASVGSGFSSGEGISVDRDAVLTVEWVDQSTMANRLAAGQYQDTLTMVVGPRA